MTTTGDGGGAGACFTNVLPIKTMIVVYTVLIYILITLPLGEGMTIVGLSKVSIEKQFITLCLSG